MVRNDMGKGKSLGLDSFYIANPDVDGGLIGGAALKVVDFKGIIDAFK
jgi:triosephosphate isomerase